MEEDSPIAGIIEPSIDPAELGVTEETEVSGTLTREAAVVQLDIFLHRKFRVGEFFPWKGINFQLVGINNGILGLQVKSIRNLQIKAKDGLGKRKSRSKKKSKYKPIQPK